VRVLVDTHTLLWLGTDDERLPSPTRDLLADPRTRVVVSVASTWELTLKAMAGRLRLPRDPDGPLVEYLGDFASEVLPIEQRHVAALQELPAVHADPFNRMLVAQALVEDLDLVTGDEVLRGYPVRTIW
jgi:PIN domain nuclease of toxin-antitoxin system